MSCERRKLSVELFFSLTFFFSLLIPQVLKIRHSEIKIKYINLKNKYKLRKAKVGIDRDVAN